MKVSRVNSHRTVDPRVPPSETWRVTQLVMPAQPAPSKSPWRQNSHKLLITAHLLLPERRLGRIVGQGVGFIEAEGVGREDDSSQPVRQVAGCHFALGGHEEKVLVGGFGRGNRLRKRLRRRRLDGEEIDDGRGEGEVPEN